MHINAPDQRDAIATLGTTSDPLHLVKRQAVGSLSFESFAIRPDGTMIYGDELAPSGGNAGGGIYKFVPAIPFAGGGPITRSRAVAAGIRARSTACASPRTGSSNWGQGAETGNGRVGRGQPGRRRTSSTPTATSFCATRRLLQRFTGYYRPEDMDIDPIAAENGVFRACWANTGRMSHTDSSVVENSGVKAEIMCLDRRTRRARRCRAPPTGTIPTVDRFITGSEERGMFDNVAFQPHTGNLVVLEDGPVTSCKSLNPHVTELRGNDLWICLPDGDDDDVADGRLRPLRVDPRHERRADRIHLPRVGRSRPSCNIQHRDVDAADHRGSLMMISGFKVKDKDKN